MTRGSHGFDTESWLLDFLRMPARALGGQTPLSVMDSESGRAQVKSLLDQLHVG